MKIKLNLEEQIKWYDTFLYYSDLFPNDSIECVIKLTNEVYMVTKTNSRQLSMTIK